MQKDVCKHVCLLICESVLDYLFFKVMFFLNGNGPCYVIISSKSKKKSLKIYGFHDLQWLNNNNNIKRNIN